MTTQTETHSFEAEVQEVLSLVIHSLYANKEIFLRELISNASDALDKLRFQALTDPSLMADGETLGIALDADQEARVLRIADNGIGMSHDELVENLGRIASSGTKRFVAAMQEAGAEAQPELIGQFGVGFYSAFMVADEVVVETRKAGEEHGWRWRSKGDGSYAIEAAEDLARGTLVSLHLREVDEGRDDPNWSDPWVLRRIVERYSDFVEYPIQMEVERQKPKLDEDGKPVEGETETVLELETLNSMKPLWARAKDEITEEDHAEFYRHVSHDWNEPLDSIHFSAEGALEYTALLYIPKEPPLDLFDPSKRESNVSLYVKRVLIQKECEDLLPSWLRFVRGVVECADIPLNVSRETLQDNPRIKQIQKRLVKKVLEALAKMLDADREKFEGFWRGFGPVLKEGIWAGDDEGERISSIAMFASSHSEELTTLGEYVERMPEGQDEIYVLTGPDLRTVLASPHLEGLKAQGHEVLFLVDPVDEWVLQRLQEWGGKKVVAVDRGEAQSEDEAAKKAREEKQKEHEGLLAALKEALDDEIEEVRFTTRLKESPAVLVAGALGMSGHMERLLRRSGQDVPKQKRVLELNPDHALVVGLEKLYAVDEKSPRISEYAELLHGQALLAEGAAPVDPARFGKLLTELMVQSVRGSGT